MKVILALYFVACFPFSAFGKSVSNYIQVDDLDAKTSNGEVIQFKGGDAFKLLESLPKDSLYSGSRSLTITGKDRSFTISCIAGTSAVEDKVYKIDPKSTECKLIVGKSFKPGKVESPQVWVPTSY